MESSSSMYVAWNLNVSTCEKNSETRLQCKFKKLMNDDEWMMYDLGKLKDVVMKFSVLINEG